MNIVLPLRSGMSCHSSGMQLRLAAASYWTPVGWRSATHEAPAAGIAARPGTRRQSTAVMDLMKSVHGCVEADRPGLELQREIERVVSRLVQVSAVEPQRLDLGGLPHIALLALPGAGILCGARPQPPYLADAIGDLLGDEVGRPAVH